MIVPIIPDEAVASCRDLALWLQRAAIGEDSDLRASFVYRCYVRALASQAEPVRSLRWRRFIRGLDAYVRSLSRNSHAAAHLRSIVAENADLLGHYGSITDASPAVAV
jgi:hypothetical protein